MASPPVGDDTFIDVNLAGDTDTKSDASYDMVTADDIPDTTVQTNTPSNEAGASEAVNWEVKVESRRQTLPGKDKEPRCDPDMLMSCTSADVRQKYFVDLAQEGECAKFLSKLQNAVQDLSSAVEEVSCTDTIHYDELESKASTRYNPLRERARAIVSLFRDNVWLSETKVPMLSSSKDTRESQATFFKKKLDEYREKYQTLKETSKQCQVDNEWLKRSRGALKAENEKYRQKERNDLLINDELFALRQRTDLMNKRVLEIESQKAAAERDCSRHKDQLHLAEEGLDAMSEQNKFLRKEKYIADKEHDSLKEQVSELETALQLEQQTVESQNNQLESMRLKISDQQAETKALQEKADSAEKTVEDLSRALRYQTESVDFYQRCLYDILYECQEADAASRSDDAGQSNRTNVILEHFSRLRHEFDTACEAAGKCENDVPLVEQIQFLKERSPPYFTPFLDMLLLPTQEAFEAKNKLQDLEACKSRADCLDAELNGAKEKLQALEASKDRAELLHAKLKKASFKAAKLEKNLADLKREKSVLFGIKVKKEKEFERTSGLKGRIERNTERAWDWQQAAIVHYKNASHFLLQYIKKQEELKVQEVTSKGSKTEASTRAQSWAELSKAPWIAECRASMSGICKGHQAEQSANSERRIWKALKHRILEGHEDCAQDCGQAGEEDYYEDEPEPAPLYRY